MRTQLWSSGGGTQSFAIAAMIVLGEIEKPDLSVIVDTERECSTTWEYHETFVVPALLSVGVTINRVRKSEFATVDLWRNDKILIPAYTDLKGKRGDRGGKLPTFCSNEWKSRVVRRWATQCHGVSKAFMWLGFSQDEEVRAWRAKENETEKWRVRCPLLEARMNRHDCLAKVAAVGWPPPPRSRCWMCPNQGLAEWREILAGIDRFRIVAFENEIQQTDPHVWLTASCEPIGLQDFSDSNLRLFSSECESGSCFV